MKAPSTLRGPRRPPARRRCRCPLDLQAARSVRQHEAVIDERSNVDRERVGSLGGLDDTVEIVDERELAATKIPPPLIVLSTLVSVTSAPVP